MVQTFQTVTLRKYLDDLGIPYTPENEGSIIVHRSFVLSSVIHSPLGCKDGKVDIRSGQNMVIMPDRLSVAGHLTILGDVIDRLPDFLEAHSLSLEGCKRVSVLPSGLAIKRELMLRDGTSITEIPVGLNVRTLYLGAGSIAKLPKGLTLHELNIGHTYKWVIPEGLNVKHLSLALLRIEDFPADTRVSSTIAFCGRYGVIIDLTGDKPWEISIGCKSNSVAFWKAFFKDRMFFETNPDTHPTEYAEIVADFEYALKLYERFKPSTDAVH